MRFLYITIVCTTILIVGCMNNTKNNDSIAREVQSNPIAKELLQGIWFLSDSDTPFLKVAGDSLCFYEQPGTVMAFNIVQDSLYTFGSGTYGYKIDKQSEYMFWFHSISNHVIKLYKSENLEDTIYFEHNDTVEENPVVEDQEVVQRDSIVYFDNTRYHGYAFINPSSFKVYKPMYSDDGIRIDQIYYDNVIYICVYQGTEKLFGQNIYKDHFKDILESNFFNAVILADMDFIGVDETNYYFQAKVEIPNSLVYDLIKISVNINTQELLCELLDK